MRINNFSSTTFTSKIHFVPSCIFAEIINPNEQKYVSFAQIKSISPPCDSFYSVELKSCSGGGVVEPGKSCVGFHIFDCKENLEKVNENIEEITTPIPKATRGLLIGGKDLPRAKYSLKHFEKLKESLLNKVENLSCFKMHAYKDEETNYLYDAKNDEWYLNTQFASYENGRHVSTEVESLKTLKQAFKEVKIAKGDELYICGLEVKKEDAPEFFE